MRYNSRIVAILGTVIIHLTAGIIFMSFKLYALKTKEKEADKKFEIEFAAIEEKKITPKTSPLTSAYADNQLREQAEMMNIARNLASKSDVKVDAKDYINQVKDELIKSGKLGKDNYIDNPRDVNEGTQEDQYLLQKTEKEKEDKTLESQKMAANYRGPTRIYYDLAGRNHTYLPIPIYKCEGSGKIVLIIDVDQRGLVENASVLASGSTTTDECLVETAVGTALVSRFEPNSNAPRIQKGTLTYLFVAQ